MVCWLTSIVNSQPYPLHSGLHKKISFIVDNSEGQKEDGNVRKREKSGFIVSVRTLAFDARTSHIALHLFGANFMRHTRCNMSRLGCALGEMTDTALSGHNTLTSLTTFAGALALEKRDFFPIRLEICI